MRDATVRRASRFHRTLYRWTGGRFGTRLVDNNMLLLTTTGHVTGNAHTVPLLYLTDGPQYVVIASYGGRPQNPAWYLNLAANPVVQVQIGKARFSARAATVGPEDRRRLWPVVVEAYDGYAVYQARTEREIPVVLIHPDD